MLNDYLNFVKKVSLNQLGKWGVVLTTSSFATFIVLELARLLGILTNSYIGLITYLLFPTLFVIGLILIPIAWNKQKKNSGKTTRELLDSQFGTNETAAGFFGSKIMLSVAGLSLVNILFLSIASTQMLDFMDEPVFCGTACHSVMHPEWITYQQSPHARVHCVECHVGEGTGALISSKLNGAYQMLSVTFKLYEKPIPTPVHQLRPARETCEKCHWPEKFYGTRIKSYVRYQMDEASTPEYTTLNLKIDTGKGKEKAGIHWHIAAKNQVRYAAADEKRLKMLWVEEIKEDGTVIRYKNTEAREDELKHETEARTMDCVDCHNRATHIYEDPSMALDDRIQKGLIDHSLPFIKREGLASISNYFKTREEGQTAIRKHIESFYRRNYPKLLISQSDKIDQAIKTLQAIYHRNIHPGMNIIWGSYPNFLGHQKDSGCFRCHNGDFVSEDGQEISYECTTCHSILALEEANPFSYLFDTDE